MIHRTLEIRWSNPKKSICKTHRGALEFSISNLQWIAANTPTKKMEAMKRLEAPKNTQQTGWKEREIELVLGPSRAESFHGGETNASQG